MSLNKFKSFLKLGIGASVTFIGLNVYFGEDKFYYQLYSNLLKLAHGYVDPETSHYLAIKCAKYNIGVNFKSSKIIYPNLQTSLWNIKFDNPIGLAAGFDKHGEAINGLSKIGFGFIEVGSITPLPQNGNCKPRVFRLIEDKSIINRYGFNSVGHIRAKGNIMKQRALVGNYPIGINLGKNKLSNDSVDDFTKGLNEFKGQASYFVINISSPNTPGLRDLQNKEELDNLLKRTVENKKKCNDLSNKPLLVKISPDLTEKQEQEIAKLLLKYKVDGIIISNTTISRDDIINKKYLTENGGLSGKALKEKSTNLIKRMYKLTHGKIPIIGVGGVSSGKDAFEKILAGASLIQVYTALIYEGPLLINKIKKELSELLKSNGYDNVKNAVGKSSS